MDGSDIDDMDVDEDVRVASDSKAYSNNILITNKKDESPNKDKWALLPLIYKDSVDDESRWQELGLGSLGFTSVHPDVNMFDGVSPVTPQLGSLAKETECLPISFRIRTDIFNDTSLSRFNQANEWMNQQWTSRMGATGRVDCSFTTLAILDLPISEFFRGQDFIMNNYTGLQSSLMDIQYSSIHNDSTVIPHGGADEAWSKNNKSVLPMNKISYLWHYSENYTSTWGKWLNDLYGSIPPYSGIILITSHMHGGHFCVMARGKYEKRSGVDPDTCYIFDAQRSKTENKAYNRGKGQILNYLNGVGVYYMAIPCIRLNEEKELIDMMPFEFDDDKNLVSFSGFGADGEPLRKERKVTDIVGEMKSMKMGMYTGKLGKKKKRGPSKKDKPKKKKKPSKKKSFISSLRNKFMSKKKKKGKKRKPSRTRRR